MPPRAQTRRPTVRQRSDEPGGVFLVWSRLALPVFETYFLNVAPILLVIVFVLCAGCCQTESQPGDRGGGSRSTWVSWKRRCACSLICTYSSLPRCTTPYAGKACSSCAFGHLSCHALQISKLTEEKRALADRVEELERQNGRLRRENEQLRDEVRLLWGSRSGHAAYARCMQPLLYYAWPPVCMLWRRFLTVF